MTMDFYFLKKNERDFRGKRFTTLPFTLVQNLDKHNIRGHNIPLKLNMKEYLELLRSLAEGREGEGINEKNSRRRQ